IVVILLGVFFTMGYIVGHNSTPIVADAAAPSRSNTPEAEPPARPPENPPAESAPAAETATSRPLVTEPQRPEPEPAVEKSTPSPKTKSLSDARPAAGQAYLQLAATSQHEADIMVDVLQKKGFKAMAAEIEERPGTFRVLVGPILDSTNNKVRAELQSAGFPGNAAIRRTF